MKPSLQVRLSQHLALTPQLQQSIRLLQLSTLELHQEVESMLEQNPFLEEDTEAPEPASLSEGLREDAREDRREDTPDEAADAAAEGAVEAPTWEREAADRDRADVAETAEPEEAAALDAPEATSWEEGGETDEFEGVRDSGAPRASGGEDDDTDPVERASPGLTLQDHLRQQLLGIRLSPADAAAVHILIDSLDEDGYLADSLEEIVERLAGAGEADREQREELLEQLQCALKWLQSMEPIGIGARSLSECLCLQLRARPTGAAQRVASSICRDHLDALAKRDLKKLTAALGVDEELIKQAQALIVTLEPKPGRPFINAEAQVIVPDVIVQRAGRGWRAVLNPDVMPKLRINDLYAQALRQHRGDASAQALSARLQEARWFVKNIQQRFDTIQRVSQAIIERQRNFFSHGAIAMKPLVLREIADELGLHESTISRVTTAKYMATPFGTFELKYFFGSSLNTEAGGNASSTAVRALLKQLVAAEDARKPLSDSQLSKMLEEQGIQVARRTVAKYREALKIAPANLRKAM